MKTSSGCATGPKMHFYSLLQMLFVVVRGLRMHLNKSKHCYRTGLWSKSFVPVVFGPRIKECFSPGSNAWPEQRGEQGPFAFVPVGVSNRDQRPRGPMVPDGATNRDKWVGIWSRLVAPTGTKGPCLYSLSSSNARAILLSVLAVLGSGGGSSCPFRPRFVKTL